MSEFHTVKNVSFDEKNLFINIDGKDFSFKLSKISKRLAKATMEERETFEVSPSGYGIHWPLIDEDLSIDGFLGISHKPRRKSKEEFSAS